MWTLKRAVDTPLNQTELREHCSLEEESVSVVTEKFCPTKRIVKYVKTCKIHALGVQGLNSLWDLI